MTTPKNFGAQDPVKGGRSRFVSSKKHDFRPNSWTETLILPIFTTSTPPCHTWLESYGSQLQFGTKLSRFEGSFQPSEFWWHVGTETCHWSVIKEVIKNDTAVLKIKAAKVRNDQMVRSSISYKRWLDCPTDLTLLLAAQRQKQIWEIVI